MMSQAVMDADAAELEEFYIGMADTTGPLPPRHLLLRLRRGNARGGLNERTDGGISGYLGRGLAVGGN